jgi:phage-related minor tail protein
MVDETFDSGGDAAARAAEQVGKLEARTAQLAISANGFASAMTRAFSQSVIGGKQFDDVLRSLGSRLSSLVVSAAFKPIASGITSGISGGLDKLFSGLGGGDVKAATGGIKPFAAGGVIGTPTYFPLMNGGMGLAGEAGPEAILPLTRGADGQLGVVSNGAGGGGPNVTIHISTPDAESFRRSETYIAGQIARAVARGQRSL